MSTANPAPVSGGASIDILTTLSAWVAELGDWRVQMQLALVAGVLVVALLVARRVRLRWPDLNARSTILRHLAFSLTAVLLLEVVRFTLRHAGLKASVVGVATQLAFAMVVLRIIELALRQVFSRSGWLHGAERYLAVSIWTLVALDLVGLLGEIVAWMDSLSFHVGKQTLSMWTLVQGSLTIVGTMIAALWIGGLIEARLLQSERMDSSVRAVLGRVLRAVLIFFGVVVAMSLVGIDLTTLSVFSGALGIGLGLGMQKIASNYVSGFIILLDRSIRIGNLISVGTDRGEVKEITTRYTVLRAMNGINVIVPNETLIAAVVQNETFADKNVWMSIRVQVAYSADVERTLALLEECALVHERVLRDPKPTAFLVAFADSGIDLDLGFWIHDPLQGSLGIRSAINREIWRRFREEGIEIPFPQREVRIVGPAAGPAEQAAAAVAAS